MPWIHEPGRKEHAAGATGGRFAAGGLKFVGDDKAATLPRESAAAFMARVKLLPWV